MALIKCPDCGQTVSDKTITCLKCGRPIASAVTPLTVGGVQTIEKTSKKLKGWLAIGYAVFIGSIAMIFASAVSAFPGGVAIGWLGLLGGAVVVTVVRLKIWWEHE